MERKKILRGLIVGIAVSVITLGLFFLDVFRVMEWKSWDLRLQTGADAEKTADDIVLIFIDQQSLDAYSDQQGLSWPWPRQMYAYLLDYLRQGGARAVVLDLIFSEASVWGVEDDALFSQGMKQSGNVFLPVHMSKEEDAFPSTMTSSLQKHAVSGKAIPSQAVFPANSVSLPVEELLNSCLRAGNVQFSPDGDGIYRRMPLAFSFAGKTYPSLPLAVLRFLEPDFNITEVPLDRTGQMILNYSGPTRIYPAYAAAAVINSLAQLREGKEPQVPLGSFRNKIVLLGGSAPGLLDLRPTPFSPVSPGVGIHAAAVDNLLRRDFIRVPAVFVLICVVLFLSLGVALGTTLITKIWKLVLFALVSLCLPALLAWLSFHAGYWLEFVAPLFAVILSFASATVLNYQVEGRQKRFIKRVFHHYLSPHVIDRIIDDPGLLKLGGESREITSFFSDVAGFTSISEGLTPEELVDLLNDYLTEMTEIILDSGGTLDKYEGDAIIAFWNAPLDLWDHAARACRAAVDCQLRLKELNPRFKEQYGHELRMRIGLNSGPAVVGNMGSHRRFDYTAMGDTINLAARLEGACKQYGIETLASEFTHGRLLGAESKHAEGRQQGNAGQVGNEGQPGIVGLQGGVAVREVDIIRVVGKKRPVRIYEVLGKAEDMTEKQAFDLEQFRQALECYRNREWQKAEDLLRGLDQDPVARTYLGRIQDLKADLPPADWDGVFDLTKK
jgi:adenylate cyclase